ncbi:MAG: septum formation protein Maf [Clostridia bacterium]|nr:septum formation protein Maf [Clostridia bacterium]
MSRIILASGSPRRRELLGKLYDKFEVITSEVDESLDGEITPLEGVEILSVRKGRAVAEKLPEDCIVISSDTLVEIGGEPLGKPTSREDAHRMLSLLSDNYHNVHTGIAVHHKGRVISGVASARVKFKPLSDEEIYAYIDGGEPMDKAGAYAIQGEGGKFIEGYDGDFDTIMGLSVSLTKSLIERITEND